MGLAATKLISMHVNKGKTEGQSLAGRLKYARDEEKTDEGEYVTAYACNADIAEKEFELERNIYLRKTGREYKGDIIAYQIRQSFKPGEITPEDAMVFLGFSEPGRTRQESIKNALLFCNGHMADSATVMIHDAVRPLVTAELIEDCCRKMDGYDGVTPAIPIKDTVYISNSGTQFDSNIDRNTLYAGQTPEFFDYWKYYKVITGLNDEEINRTSGSSQPAVSAGLRIAIAKGNEENFKITTAEDLARFRKIKETGTKYRF